MSTSFPSSGSSPLAFPSSGIKGFQITERASVGIASALSHHLTLVGAGNSGARGAARGVDGAGLADVNDGGIITSIDSGAGALGSVGIGELDRVEVGEGNQGQTLLEVLNNPLGVVLAQVGLGGGGRKGVGHGLAGGGVLEGGGTGAGAGGLDGHGDGVTSRDVEVEVVSVVYGLLLAV